MKIKLADVIEDIAAGPFGSNLKVESFVSKGFPIIDGANLKGVKVTDDITKFVTNEKAYSLKRSIAGRGDVIVTISGTLGQIAYIPDDSLYGEYLVSQRQFRVTFDKNKVDPRFIVYYFHTTHGQKQILAFANYVGVPALSQPLDNFRKIEVDLPSLEAQQAIANALSVVEAKIDNNNAIATELEDMAKDLYDYWFVQFDFPDENGKPYKSSGGKMVWNEELKREIPEEWEVDRLGKHIISSRGISYNSANLEGDGVPMINLASFGVDSNYKPAGIKTYNGQYDADKILYPFDLIMCNTQQTAIDPTKDIIGKAMLVPDIFDGDVVSSHHVTTITPDVDELKYYLYGTCKTTWFHKYIVGFASGTNILGLDFKGFEDYLMPLPPMRLLKKFATAMKNIESEKNLIITENAELASLRDFLLPMLMNGQVKVKVA